MKALFSLASLSLQARFRLLCGLVLSRLRSSLEAAWKQAKSRVKTFFAELLLFIEYEVQTLLAVEIEFTI